MEHMLKLCVSSTIIYGMLHHHQKLLNKDSRKNQLMLQALKEKQPACLMYYVNCTNSIKKFQKNRNTTYSCGERIVPFFDFHVDFN